MTYRPDQEDQNAAQDSYRWPQLEQHIMHDNCKDRPPVSDSSPSSSGEAMYTKVSFPPCNATYHTQPSLTCLTLAISPRSNPGQEARGSACMQTPIFCARATVYTVQASQPAKALLHARELPGHAMSACLLVGSLGGCREGGVVMQPEVLPQPV